MNEYFTKEEQENFINKYEKSIDAVVKKSKEFKFTSVIEISEDDLTNQLPEQGEEMFINLNFNNNTYSVIIAEEPPNPNSIQITLDSFFQATDFIDTVYIAGAKKKFVFRII